MKTLDTRINVYQDCKLILDGKIGEILELVDIKEFPVRVAKIEELMKIGVEHVDWCEPYEDEVHGLVDFEYSAAVYVEVENEVQNQIYTQGLRAGKTLGNSIAIQSLQKIINDEDKFKDLDEVKMYIYNLWKVAMGYDEEFEQIVDDLFGGGK